MTAVLKEQLGSTSKFKGMEEACWILYKRAHLRFLSS